MLLFDAREAFGAKKTGKGQWAAGVLRELLRRNVALTVFSDCEVPREWEPLFRPDHTVRVFHLRGWRWHWRVHRELRGYPGAIYLSPTSYLLPALSGAPVRFVPVVHDLIAFRHEPHEYRATVLERLTLGRALRRAHAVCTVSASTTQDLLARFPSLDARRVACVWAGAEGEPVQWQPDGRTIYCLATLCPRKNQLRLIRAFAALPEPQRSRMRLVLAGGRGWHDQEIVDAARTTPGVEWLGYVSREQSRELLAHCHLFAYPSLYEGFGLPLLDAFAAGIPTLTSRCGSLAEVAGDAALLVDPQSVDALRDGLVRLSTDSALRTECSRKAVLQASQFSWKRTADALMTHLHVDNIV